MLPEDIDNFSPQMGAVGKETPDGDLKGSRTIQSLHGFEPKGPCESGISPNPPGSLSLPVLPAPALTHSVLIFFFFFTPLFSFSIICFRCHTSQFYRYQFISIFDLLNSPACLKVCLFSYNHSVSDCCSSYLDIDISVTKLPFSRKTHDAIQNPYVKKFKAFMTFPSSIFVNSHTLSLCWISNLFFILPQALIAPHV